MRFGGGVIQGAEDRSATGFRFGHFGTTAERFGERIGGVWNRTGHQDLSGLGSHGHA